MKVFVIVLENNFIAYQQLERFKLFAEKHKWTYSVFPAINGNLIDDTVFINEGLEINQESKFSKRPGAKGCFLSHWYLWKKCCENQEPFVIMESDAVINGPMPSFNLNSLIKLHTDRGTNWSDVSGNWSKGSHAYVLSPSHAEQLIDNCKKITLKPVDVILGDKLINWRHFEYDLVSQVKLGKSTTSKMY